MDEGSGQPVAGPSSGTARGTEAADTVMAEPTWQDDTPPPLDAPVRRRRKQGFARAQSGPVVPSLLSGNVFTALPPRATASSSQASQGGGSGASGSNGPLRRLGEYRNRNAWGPSRSHGDLRTVMPAPSSLLPASGNDADMAPIASGSTFMFGSESGAQASNEGRASRADGAKASPFKRSKSQQQSIPEGSGGTPRVGASSTSPGPWNRLAALFAQPTSPQLPRRTPSSDRIRPVGSQASSGFPLGPSWEALPPLGGDEGEMVFVRPNEAIPPPSPSDHLAARSKSKAKLKGKRRSGETGNEADDDNSGDSDGLRFSMEQDEACFVDSFPSPASSPFASLHASTLLSSPSASTSKIDFLAALPTEVALYTLLCVDDFATLLKCMEVSRTWYILARDNVVWRKMFARKEDEGWKIRPEALANQCPPDSTPPLTSSSTFATSRPLDAEGRQLSQSRSRPSLRASRSSSTRSAVADVAALAERSGSVGGRLGRKLSEILGELGGLTIAPLAGGGVVGTEHLPPASNGKLSLTPRTSRLTGEGVGDYAWLGHASDVAAGGLDWWKLYRDRWLLQQRWTYGVMEKEYLKGHTDGVYCIQFDNEKVITGSRDKSIKVWDLATGALLRSFTTHSGSVLCLRYDSTMMLTGSSDCCVFVWDLPSFTVVRRLVGHSSGILDVAFDSRWIVSCSKDTSIRIWDRETGRHARTLQGHNGPVNAIQLKDNLLLSASGDAFMKLWNVETGEVVRTYEGHKRGLACIRWVGDLAVSGSNDQTVKVWDVETGKCLRTLTGHEGLVRAVAVDPPSNRLVSGSYDKTVKIWDFSTGDMLLDCQRAQTGLVFDVQLDCSRVIAVGHNSPVMILNFGKGLDCSKFE